MIIQIFLFHETKPKFGLMIQIIGWQKHAANHIETMSFHSAKFAKQFLEYEIFIIVG